MKQILHRVLSFDGGGIRGLYHAKLLERLKARNLDVAKRADIVTGTSTGAIVAAAVAIGKGPEEISALYTDVGQKVFPAKGMIGAAVNGAFYYVTRESYSPGILRKTLEAQFKKSTKLGDCKTRLLIPAISLNQYKLKVFDSADEGDKDHGLVDVVLASAAAPTYFPPAQVGDTWYVDGGLCCNNPAFRAVAQLVREQVELSRIHVLSISTGAMPVTKTGDEFKDLRKVSWARPVIDLAMFGSSDLAVQDSALVGYDCRITENFESQIELDDYERAIKVLPALARDKAKEVEAKVKRWVDGPPMTGQDFSGTWDATFTWGEPAESGTETLRIEQCGDHIVGETIPGTTQWPYTLSGTVDGEVCIGTWKGPKLQGNFLLIMSKEHPTVRGRWVGTGDAGPYFGTWLWNRKT
jgi:predicted acylesterase/phospholipase RssA